MTMPPDLILITHNRLTYVEKTVEQLLSDKADFRLYCWDNASQDGTVDLIRSLDDPRVKVKHFNEENVGQHEPCTWFLNTATSDVVGKIDDDVLLPPGWTERLAPMIRAESQFGMLGCWIFMEEDWDESKARLNTIETVAGPVLRMVEIAGHSFLMRTTTAKKFLRRTKADHGIPINRVKMALDGYISGMPLPPLFAHNMDDPRSEHCVRYRADGSLSQLTARALGFKKPDDFSNWIAADAHQRLSLPFGRQFRRLALGQREDLLSRSYRRAIKALRLW